MRVLQIVGVENLFQAHGDGVEVATGQSAVGGETFGENQQVLLALGQ